MDNQFHYVSYSLLKERNNEIEEIVQYLEKTTWITRPNMGIGWIIRNIDDLYIIYDEKDYNKTKYVGFFVLTKRKVLDYFEIDESNQGKGYARIILERIEYNKVSVCEGDTKAISFWKHIGAKRKIKYI